MEYIEPKLLDLGPVFDHEAGRSQQSKRIYNLPLRVKLK
jgi:hypothetical protein